MKEKVFVSGHKNPDTDSICSAIAYAYLVNKKGEYDAVPVRLGPINQETEYALKTFGVESPMLLKTVKQTVEDLDYDKNTMFSKDITLRTAWDLMKAGSLEAAPVLDDDSHLVGLLTKSNIIAGYMGGWDSSILAKSQTSIMNIIDTLDAKSLYLNPDKKTYDGKIHIFAMSSESAKDIINKNDIIIIGGERDDAMQLMIDTGVSLVILTGSHGMSQEWLDKYEQAGISVISTPYNTFITSQTIIQSIPIEFVMQKGYIQSFSIADTFDEVKEVMSETRYRCYPVLDLQQQVIGSLSRYQILKGDRKKVILVDHNERGQSIDGIEQAEILEVIDHHRIANFETTMPLVCRAEPVGCTSTIIAKLYRENDVEITKQMAGLMLSAIISDTLLFKSPTCTNQDISIAKQLAKIAEVDIESYGMEMFKAGTSLKGMTVEEIYNADYKTFTYGTSSVGVAQVSSLDIDGFLPLKEEMLGYMNQKVDSSGLDFALLLVTDIINSNSELFVAGNTEIVEKEFDCTLEDNQATLYGVVSRKKQVVPAISTLYE